MKKSKDLKGVIEMPCQYCGWSKGHHPRCPEAVFEMYCDICGARIDEYENYDYRDGVTVCESCLKCTDDVEEVL